MNKSSKTFVRFCNKAFYDPSSKLFVVVNDALSVVILLSILSVIFESVSQLAAYNTTFITIEYLAVGIFSIEYLCRIVGNPKPASYIFSFFGIIDLISILPTWLHFMNLTPIKSLRALQILRFLRMIRLAKVVRFDHLEKTSRSDRSAIIRLNFQIYLATLIFTITILGSLVYVFEHGHPGFENIPLSMLWVLESLLGGSISNVIPDTYPGIFIFMIARFISLVMLGFMIHIIGNVVSHFLLGKETRHTLDREY